MSDIYDHFTNPAERAHGISEGMRYITMSENLGRLDTGTEGQYFVDNCDDIHKIEVGYAVRPMAGPETLMSRSEFLDGKRFFDVSEL